MPELIIVALCFLVIGMCLEFILEHISWKDIRSWLG